MPVSVEWLDMNAIADPALDRAHRSSLFDRLDWFRSIVRHGLAGEPLVLRARDGDTRAWLFLSRSGRRRAGPLACWYSFAFGPIGDPRLFTALFRTATQQFDVMTLTPLPEDRRAAVERALHTAGWRSFATRAATNRTIDLAGRDFDAYWEGRPAKLRNTVARRSRSHPVEIVVHTDFDASAWAEYEAVYAASWKPAEGSLPFLRDLAVAEGAAGTLRLGIARTPEGRAVAAQLWLVEDGIATIHKLAHREDARAGSPGSLLSHAMFEHAIDRDRVGRIDFGLGDEPYKTDWVDEAAPLWRIDAYRPGTVRGLIGIARERAGRLARRRRLD